MKEKIPITMERVNVYDTNRDKEQIITKEYLEANPNHIFVFGDNLLRKGTGGAAKLRDMKNTYGFITKKSPGWEDKDFYKPEEYTSVYVSEINKLIKEIKYHQANFQTLFLISKAGAGLANRFGIWEEIIEPTIKKHLGIYDNVKFLW